MEGVKKEKVQTPWIASKVLAIPNHLGLAGAWNPLAQTALNLIQDNPALKVLEGLGPLFGYLPKGRLAFIPAGPRPLGDRKTQSCDASAPTVEISAAAASSGGFTPPGPQPLGDRTRTR